MNERGDAGAGPDAEHGPADLGRVADQVDRIVDQWGVERPDLDVSAMAIIGRISRLDRAIRPRLDEVYAQHDLESWEFDVLATLRRHGEPFQLTAGQLLDATMVTSGAMTHRIDRLEDRGLVERRRHPDDGRQVLVSLTDAGRARVDRAVGDHSRNELRLVSGLDASQRQQLIDLLRALDRSIVAAPGASAS